MRMGNTVYAASTTTRHINLAYIPPSWQKRHGVDDFKVRPPAPKALAVLRDVLSVTRAADRLPGRGVLDDRSRRPASDAHARGDGEQSVPIVSYATGP